VAGDVATTGGAGTGVTPARPGQPPGRGRTQESRPLPRSAPIRRSPPRPAMARPATPRRKLPRPTGPRQDAPGSRSANGRSAAATRGAGSGRTGSGRAARRLARLGATRGGGINPVLEPMIKTVRATHPKADVRLIEHAYDVAAHWHTGQKRKSGDPLHHPPASPCHDPRRAGHEQRDRCARPCCTTRWKTPTTPSTSCAPTSVTRSPPWWTA